MAEARQVKSGHGLAADPPATDAGYEVYDEGIVFCLTCKMWLNGPTQWGDHKIGKIHKKKSKGSKFSLPSLTSLPESFSSGT